MVHQQQRLAAMIAGEFLGRDNRPRTARTGGDNCGLALRKDKLRFNGMGMRRNASDLDYRGIAGTHG